MIKTALKHWIYEICIEQLFNGIFYNFKPIQTEFKIGRMYKHVTLRHSMKFQHLYDFQIDDMAYDRGMLRCSYIAKEKDPSGGFIRGFGCAVYCLNIIEE